MQAQTNQRRKIGFRFTPIYFFLILLCFLPHVTFSQLTYKELVSFFSMDKNQITNYLSSKSKSWVDQGYDSAKDKQSWKFYGDKLIIEYFSTESKIIKYYTIKTEKCQKI